MIPFFLGFWGQWIWSWCYFNDLRSIFGHIAKNIFLICDFCVNYSNGYSDEWYHCFNILMSNFRQFLKMLVIFCVNYSKLVESWMIPLFLDLWGHWIWFCYFNDLRFKFGHIAKIILNFSNLCTKVLDRIIWELKNGGICPNTLKWAFFFNL